MVRMGSPVQVRKSAPGFEMGDPGRTFRVSFSMKGLMIKSGPMESIVES
jgi:hypothetical protein